MAGIGDWLFGSGPKIEQKATGTQAQMQFGGNDLINYLQQMMGQGGGLNAANQYDQSLLSGNGFEQFSAPYLQQFQEQIMPQIAERFAGGGALSSSGFGQALGGAATGLQSQLAQLFSQLQGQASGRQQGQFHNLSQTGLGYSPFAYHEKQGTQGLVAPLLTGAASAFSGGFGSGIAKGLFGG